MPTYGRVKVDTITYDLSGTATDVSVADIATKASPSFTGTVTVPTASANDNTTKAASTAYVQTELGDYALKAGPTFTGTINAANLVLSADLTVNGTTTTINTTTLQVEDKNIEIGKVSSPSDATADGGGLTLLGATNKTWNWVNSTDAWTSSEHIALGDNKKLLAGTGSDLEISHTGVFSLIANTGDLVIRSTNDTYLQADNNVLIGDVGNNEVFIKCIDDGAVEVYHDNAKKLETTSSGINVVGALTINGSPLAGGVSSDAQQNTVGGTNAGDSFTGTDANDNTLFGYNAGTAITSGDQNTAFGSKALDSSTTGAENVALGYECLQSVTTAQTNTAVGHRTLDACTTGGTNVAVGAAALGGLTTASENVAVGTYASTRITTGSYNTSVGHNALTRVETNFFNVAVGHSALKERVASKCTAVGYSAGKTATSGGENTFVGYESGDRWTGTRGVAIGANAGSGNGTDISGDYNIAIGYEALKGYGGNVSGVQNTAIGFQALRTLTTGYANVAIGHQALVANTTGHNNIAIGYQSMSVSTTSYINTCVGQYAGAGLTTGDNNLLLGHQGGAVGPAGNITTSDNNVVLGNNNIQNLYCADTSISSSDSRDKTDVTNFTHGLSWINKLNPITYRWDKRTWYNEYNEDGSVKSTATPDGTKKRARQHVGFLAQDVLAVEQADGFASKKDDMLIINLNEDDTAYGLKYERLVPVLVNAIKELSAKVAALEAA